MKKVTFKVSTKKEESVVPFLIKEVNKISCRVHIDFENSSVTVENVEDDMIDYVIELIDQYYTISIVDIDNISDEATLAETSQSDIVTNESKPTVVGPQSKDDLIIKKVEFENKYIEGLINRFMKTVYWAMYNMNVPEREIGEFIWTSMNEISMRYNKKGCIEYSVGDIVDCDYGIHLVGEINGAHVSAIVCNIAISGMAYVVPITRVRENLTSSSYLTLDVPEDVIYDNENYAGGTALLDKGRYLRTERFRAVIGKTNSEFFDKVLNQLSTTFNFMDNAVMNDEDKVDDTEPISESANNSEVTMSEFKSKKAIKKNGSEESALLNIIGDSLRKLDCYKTVEEQIETFLTDIGMTTSEKMVTQSFVIACNIKRINYKNIILELHNMFPEVKEDIIKLTLKENFKEWLDMHPGLVERCPKISLMAVLKVFAKRFV